MKKIIYTIILALSMFTLTGCFKMDDMEDITIYTTSYPIEFITDSLYGEHCNIKSIYPDGADIKNYKVNSLQLKEYSKSDMYVFNGLNTNEQTYLTEMFKKNKNIKIIDASSSIEYTYSEDELWLDPSNFLMISRNIRNGLLEYIESKVMKKEINEKYDELKIKISQIDAELKTIYENASHKTIVTDNNTLKYLEKYGFTVISLQENDGNVSEKNLVDARKLIENRTVKYIFTLNNTEVNDKVADLVKNTKVELLEMNNLSNLTDKQRSEKDDYFTLLNDNVEMLKKELY